MTPLAIVGGVVVALIGLVGGLLIARYNRRGQVEDRNVTETGTERQFLLEKFNELADGFETRWKEADAKWAACEEREAKLRADLDKLRATLRQVGQHLSTDDEDAPPVTD